MDKAMTVKALEVGRETNAEEWAMRQGMDIAAKHITPFTLRAALASDIAEALTSVRRLCNQGLL